MAEVTQKREQSYSWEELVPIRVNPDKIPKGTVTPHDHRIILWSLEEAVKLETKSKPVYFEVGTHYGGTTKAVCEALIIMGADFSYYTCDVRYQNKGGWFPIDKFNEVREYLASRWEGIDIDVHMIEETACEAIQKVPQPNVWCFLDGCHCRECVEQEIEHIASRIVPGGFLLLHDCGEEYKQADPCQPYHGDLRKIDVVEVVEERLLNSKDWQWITSTPPKRLRRRAIPTWFGGLWLFRRN